jgi:hypothetical protein
MSTPRTTPRGPAESTGEIAERAYRGAVLSSIVIPALQLALFRMAETMQSMPSINGGPFAGEATAFLHSGMLALALIPVASTIGAAVFAYVTADWWGVGLYWVMSTMAIKMLGGSLTAGIVFVTGMFAFFVVAAVKMGVFSRSRRRRPPRSRL